MAVKLPRVLKLVKYENESSDGICRTATQIASEVGTIGIPCDWFGWAGVGDKNDAKHVSNCGPSYFGFIDLYCNGTTVTDSRLVKSYNCE